MKITVAIGYSTNTWKEEEIEIPDSIVDPSKLDEYQLLSYLESETTLPYDVSFVHFLHFSD